jgi:crotonobetainyl-CoA:carnitine CoA-transferase CaiB-like acyl-CoA transferase
MAEPPDRGPSMTALQGVRVLDLSRVLAGPLCTMMLGDLGAEVVKVEHPQGDDTRRWGPPFAGGHSTYYLAANRNKRSVVLDLSDPTDLAVAQDLASTADVLVQNFRVGGLARFGLDEPTVRAANRAIVYCSLSGYGAEEGAHRPGYDFLAQAEGGMMSITGPGPDQPTKVGVAVSDVLTGLHATIGVLAALRHRERTSEGQHVQVDLLSSTLAALVNQASGYLDAGVVPGPAGNVHPSIAPYQTLRTATQPLALAIGNDRQFRTLCEALGRPRLADEPRFETNAARVEAREALVRELESVLVTETASTWQDRLGARGVPCGQVNDLAAAFHLAAVLGLEPTVTMELGGGGRTRQVASPVRLATTPVAYRLPPPSLDEHGHAIRAGATWLEPAAHAEEVPG